MFINWRADKMDFSFFFFSSSHCLFTMRPRCKEKQRRVTFPPRWACRRQRWRAGRPMCGDKTICPVAPPSNSSFTLQSPAKCIWRYYWKHLRLAAGIIAAACALVTSCCCDMLHSRPDTTSAERFSVSSLGQRARRTPRWLRCFHG